MYHAKRERFLDGWDRFATFLSAIGGAAAFSQILSDHIEVSAWIAAGIALVSTLALAYGPAAKARRHAELSRDYKHLESELRECGTEVDEKGLNALEARLLRLEATEPATLGALVTQCHNELSVAFGHSGLVTPLPRHQRWLKNILDFDQSLDRPDAPPDPSAG
ncbi:hypothetical protein [Polaromonas sp.]|uniref:hypothetical protein n=1 Tax=Polaromonas sp. TaxID=1869339 RepID=UPI003267108F